MDRLLCQSVEQLAPRGGRAAVETERELVEVVVEMIVTDRALVGAEHPSLQQGDYAMHPRQQMFAWRLVALRLAVVDAALKPHVGVQAVGPHRGLPGSTASRMKPCRLSLARSGT